MAVFYSSEVITNRSFTLREYGFWTIFGPVTLTFTCIADLHRAYELDPYSLEIYRMCCVYLLCSPS